MADRPQLPEDLAWYQQQWQELLDVLATSKSDEVVPQVRQLQVRALGDEKQALEDVGLSEETDAETVLRQVFGRLQKLRRENQAYQRVHDLLSTENPEELVDTVKWLIEQLDAYEEEKKEFSEAGFSGPKHALQALESMEEQLEELYTDKEATEQPAEKSPSGFEGDTFDQLQSHMAREEKLQRELGVSAPDAIVEMVNGLADQLEDIYAERERLADLNVHGPDGAIQMVETMQDQLESVYERREQLSEYGIDDLEEALSMIENMDAQPSDVYDQEQDRTDKTGGSDVEEPAANHIENMDAQLQELDERPDSPSSSEKQRDEKLIVPGHHETSLSEMDEKDLDALPVGLIAVDPDGSVRRANQKALDWPGVEAEKPDTLVGANFFTDVAPGTSNTLFRGRFYEGVENEEMDEQFSYTYVSESTAPTNLSVQFYRSADEEMCWIAFRVLEQY